MNKLIYLSVTFLLAASNSFSQQKSFILRGMIGGIKEEFVYLYQDNGEVLTLIDSIKTQNGEFIFEGKCAQAFVAQLRISKRRRGKIFISPGEMNLFIHAKDMKYGFLIGKLTGSPAQDRYEDFQAELSENNKQKLKIAENLEIPEVQSDPVKKEQFMKEYSRLNKFKDKYYYKYASSPVVPYLLYQEYFSAKRDLNDIKKQLPTLKLANPNGMYVKNLEQRVQVIEQLKNKGEFPMLKGKTLSGNSYDLEQHKGKPILVYIWRAWTPEKNKKYYDAIQNITSSFPSLEVVSIIRNSSYNTIRVPGTLIGKLWRPEPKPELNCIEIESLDKSVELVRYLDKRFQAYILDKEGKILYNQDVFDSKLLKSQLSKYLSAMNQRE